jgi:hypothetical protein
VCVCKDRSLETEKAVRFFFFLSFFDSPRDELFNCTYIYNNDQCIYIVLDSSSALILTFLNDV